MGTPECLESLPIPHKTNIVTHKLKFGLEMESANVSPTQSPQLKLAGYP